MVKGKKILLMGIGGIGVSALARLYLNRGALITGCDAQGTTKLENLKADGVRIIDEGEIRVCDYDWIIHTNAISSSHPILLEAQRNGILVSKRGEALSVLLSDGSSIGVTGSHGKTTTTFMIGTLLTSAGLSPCIYGGGVDMNQKTNFIPGNGSWLVAEMDESDRTFVKACPQITVITNLEHEHVNEYPTFESQIQVFRDYLRCQKPESILIVNGDDPVLNELAEKNFKGKRMIRCGKKKENDYQWLEMREERDGLTVRMRTPEGEWICRTFQYGRHNVYNMTLAAACAHITGINGEKIEKGFMQFKGVKRRMEKIKDLPQGGKLITDYGHHPTEIKAVLMTLRNQVQTGERMVAVFEAHRMSRLMSFLDNFAEVLSMADEVILADIHTAGEKGDPEPILDDLRKKIGTDKCFRVKTDKIPSYIESYYQKETVVLLTAGDLDSLVREES
ncbi:MAG: UDP-N-acetylmuramate--L-alanine ligase [Candidatus Aureabacteria bacterium]|nr:UDP-N-acetylmuramate--L-alanine ligase [Candidatus Auribacterota bacterium]